MGHEIGERNRKEGVYEEQRPIRDVMTDEGDADSWIPSRGTPCFFRYLNLG